MSLYNIITQTQSQPSSLASGFGGKEGLKDFIDNVGRDAFSIIFYYHPDPLPPEGGFKEVELTVTVGTNFI